MFDEEMDIPAAKNNRSSSLPASSFRIYTLELLDYLSPVPVVIFWHCLVHLSIGSFCHFSCSVPKWGVRGGKYDLVCEWGNDQVVLCCLKKKSPTLDLRRPEVNTDERIWIGRFWFEQLWNETPSREVQIRISFLCGSGSRIPKMSLRIRIHNFHADRIHGGSTKQIFKCYLKIVKN